MKRLLFLLLLLPIPCRAATSISRNGSCAGAAAVTCTFSATSTGSLKLIWAYHNNSLTAPTLPTGWTTISTAATASGGTVGSYRLGCNISSSSGDTGSGSWTSATDVIGASYAGTNTDTTADCALLVGASAFQNAKTSATVTYSALTLLATDGSSYVTGFAGSSAGVPGTTGTMTNITTAGTGPAVTVADTNAGVSSWSSGTASVTSGTWMSGVVEILAVASISTTYNIQRWMGVNQEGNTVSAMKGVDQSGSLSGNTLLIGITYGVGSGATLAFSDASSDTFTSLATVSNSNQTVSVFCGQPTAGTIAVTGTFTGGTPSFVHIIEVEEVKGITNCTADKTSTNSGTSQTIAAGSFTTTANSDFIFQVAEEDGSTAHEDWISGPSPFALLNASRAPSTQGPPAAAQSQLQAALGPINPTMFMNTSDSFATVAVAMKTSAVGTAPPSLYVSSVQNEYLGTIGTPFVSQFPCVGNTIAVVGSLGPGLTLSTITDSNGNTYTQIGTALTNASSGVVQTFYAKNVTCTQNNVLTVNATGSTAGASNIQFYDIVGADTAAPYDATAGRQTATGNQTISGNLNGPSITPTRAHGVILWQIAQESNTDTGIATNGNFTCGLATPPEGTNDPQCDNNGMGIFYNSASTSYTVTWTVNGALAHWASSAVAFQPPAAGGPPTNQFPRIISKEKNENTPYFTFASGSDMRSGTDAVQQFRDVYCDSLACGTDYYVNLADPSVYSYGHNDYNYRHGLFF